MPTQKLIWITEDNMKYPAVKITYEDGSYEFTDKFVLTDAGQKLLEELEKERVVH